ncbi:Sec-independent protein translocase subunit TatA [Herbiconiux daphne]|uniref:Sec-independent protein translocase protein TatA n=1 Tax=Herbiconiux daphne TaxID=2970914 RepID=A0ABT2GZM2_9MICO|nr:Sec-independent protein translocase subunit TatA [Herbiconiux daphne]MCS5733363.1 Sec-independent protein translocase subunit TatA [Herbiconiux daphne]
MLGNLNGWHLVIILVVILLLFGATRLPALSKSLGQSMRIFRNETKAMKEENAADKPAEPTVVSTQAEPLPGATTTDSVPSAATLPETKTEPKS